jgi:hypothetical protein
MKRGFTAKLLLPATIIVLALISLTGNSQTYNRDFMDGKVYIKFKD